MVTRTAILIGCSGGYRGLSFLPGVSIDLENYSNFLKSKAGGQWKEEEIIILRDPIVTELEQKIGKSNPDYSFVVYSGHGIINTYDSEDIICLKDSDASIQELVTKSHKQVIVIDAARRSESPVNLNKSVDLKITKQADGIDTRNIFDESIAGMPNGILLMFSAQVGQLSGDDKNLGGYFSYSLIKSGFDWWNNNNKGIMRINTAVDEASRIMKSVFSSVQKPEMAGQSRRITYPPFAIGKTF